MANEREMFELLGRALGDGEFRAGLIQDPAQAADSMGISLSEKQLADIKETDFAAAAAEGLDERLSKWTRRILPY